MPVTLGQPPAKRCRQCEETNRSDTGPHSWSLELDQDLVDTIAAVYPEWFNNKAMSQPEVDQSPLNATMDKNKESLKVKLMMRRPINQLVAQGILPPLKTPPAFHEQRQKLERAKTGDLLKAKIQRRPDRDELVRQHILEADMHVDPSLAERQRMLKKARLADSLNDQLSHRPGPLELIQKNILHTDEPIERAVKEGQIPFKATSEGALRKPQHPDHYVTFDDDSQSSDASQNSLPTLEPTPTTTCALPKRDVLETAAASAGIVTVAVFPAELCSPLSLGSSTSSMSPISSPPTPLTPRPAPMASPAPPSKADKSKKKSKSKPQPKTRTIKFHEYKGPPSAQKSSSSNIASSVVQPVVTAAAVSSTVVPNETSYELLLQQQQLFLQWQVELHHKYPQMLLPDTGAQTSHDDLKIVYQVNDVKEELKKRTVAAKQMRVKLEPGEVKAESPPPPSPAPSAMDTSESVAPTSPPQTGDDIIQLQQRKIQELERQLLKSQEQLAQIQRKDPIPLKAVIQNGIIHIDPKKLFLQPAPAKPSNVNVKASLAARINQHQAQQQLNQLLKNRILVPVEVKKPPVYEVLKPAVEPIEVKSVKSQIVDDLLEILIKNGELPPEAVNDPAQAHQAPASPFPPPYIEHMATDVPLANNNNTQSASTTDFDDSSALNGNLKDFELDLDSLGTMDFSALNNNEPMDMDDLWTGTWSAPTAAPPPGDHRHYDPLLGANHDPLELFNLEDELRHSSMSWDRVDFAT